MALWGYKSGCSFATTHCTPWAAQNPGQSYFCTVPIEAIRKSVSKLSTLNASSTAAEVAAATLANSTCNEDYTSFGACYVTKLSEGESCALATNSVSCIDDAYENVLASIDTPLPPGSTLLHPSSQPCLDTAKTTHVLPSCIAVASTCHMSAVYHTNLCCHIGCFPSQTCFAAAVLDASVSSRCIGLENTATKDSGQAAYYGATCLPAHCTDSSLVISVHGIEIECQASDEDGQAVVLAEVPGLEDRGFSADSVLRCPSYASRCGGAQWRSSAGSEQGMCSGLSYCSGTGECYSGMCYCHIGWTGTLQSPGEQLYTACDTTLGMA